MLDQGALLLRALRLHTPVKLRVELVAACEA